MDQNFVRTLCQLQVVIQEDCEINKTSGSEKVPPNVRADRHIIYVHIHIHPFSATHPDNQKKGARRCYRLCQLNSAITTKKKKKYKSTFLLVSRCFYGFAKHEITQRCLRKRGRPATNRLIHPCVQGYPVINHVRPPLIADQQLLRSGSIQTSSYHNE